ncbi:MAG TPA: hypothetical protein DER64_23175 [Planctomycetaceae bacterium]|nr:hypothetical protein [Planctomycetaceae bacterium]|tara:strand:+ start:795 stop:1028 length:234 start_codon:yes stop_codon:yes gene_type:complete
MVFGDHAAVGTRWQNTMPGDSAIASIDRGTTWPEAVKKMITNEEEEAETENDFGDEDENDDFSDDEFDQLVEHRMSA